MLMISISSFYDQNNEFKIKELYVSDEKDLYIMKSSESFVPYKYNGSVKDLFDSVKNSTYPVFSMSNIRTYEDDDPKSLSQFLFKKISNTDLKKRGAHKALFDVLSVFGKEAS
jgi:hypothetical protein